MEEVLERTDRAMKLWPGTLYGSLRELEAEGWLQETEAPKGAPTEGGKRRFYGITADGSVSLAAEIPPLKKHCIYRILLIVLRSYIVEINSVQKKY